MFLVRFSRQKRSPGLNHRVRLVVTPSVIVVTPTVIVVTPFVIVVTPIPKNYCFAASKKSWNSYENFLSLLFELRIRDF